MQKLSTIIFYNKKALLDKLVMEYLIILFGQGFGCITYSKDGFRYLKSVTSLCLQYFMNRDSWTSYTHQEFLKKTTLEKELSHLLSLYHFIYSFIHLLFVYGLQNVTSLSHFWLFQTSTCIEIHTLQSKYFIS